MAEEGEDSELGVASVKHALIASVSVENSEDSQKILVSFISGEGSIVDNSGDAIDPLLFTLEIYPSSDFGTHDVADTLIAWKNTDTPLDVTVKEESATFYSPEEQRVVKISF